MTPVFQEYSRFYDLIYSEKDYENESAFVMNLLRECQPNIKTLLDLGCGTGRHNSYLLKQGLEVWGIDQSKTMLEVAKHKYPEIKNNFISGDVTEVRLGKKFDAVISLFHVLSYQITDDSVLRFFQTVESHLEDDGVAAIDFWYGPGVLHLKPEKREKIFTNKDFEVNRLSTPTELRNKNIVEIELELNIFNKNNQERSRTIENHRMRYFFSDDIERMLVQTKLRLVETKEWLSRKELNPESWSAYVLLQKGHR